MKSKIKRYCAEIIIMISTFLLIVAFIFSTKSFDLFNNNDADINGVYYCIAILISAALIWIAYKNLTSINNEVRASFLLEIDKRFGNEENIKAKAIIHEMYLDVKNDKSIPEPCWRSRIGEQIINLSCDKNKSVDFMHVLCFLNFMETIGCFYRHNNANFEEIKDLCAPSLLFYFEIFKPYIDYRRRDDHDKTLYCWFEKLYNDLKQAN